jgi:cephalosporin hydroxylase
MAEPDTAIPYHLLMSIQQGAMAYRYRGVPMLKNPFDMAIYPLVLAEARPRTIIEIGSHLGGSALWFADICGNLGMETQVVSVDLVPVSDLHDPRLRFLGGDALSLGDTLTEAVLEGLPRPWAVIEDSAHTYAVTRAVLAFFDRRMAAGEYLVVEDAILGDMRVAELYDGGPGRAIAEFLGAAGGRYGVERRFCDYFGRNVTWNVDGYLRRRP